IEEGGAVRARDTARGAPHHGPALHARYGRGGGAMRAGADDGRRARAGRRQPGRALQCPWRGDARGRLHAPDRQDAGGGGRGGGGVDMTIDLRRSDLSALLGVAERQLYVYKRYWVWEVVWLFY